MGGQVSIIDGWLAAYECWQDWLEELLRTLQQTFAAQNFQFLELVQGLISGSKRVHESSLQTHAFIWSVVEPCKPFLDRMATAKEEYVSKATTTAQ